MTYYVDMLDLSIETLDGSFYTMSGLGVKTLEFIVQSPEINIYYEQIPGLPGLVELESTLEQRTLTGRFIFDAGEAYNFAEKRDELIAIFARDKKFYLQESRSVGRRWLVRLNKPFAASQVRMYGIFELEFISASPFSESTFISETNFSTNRFTFNNQGTAPINMRAQTDTAIRVTGATSGLQIKNLTTGTEWSYEGTSDANGTIELRGVSSNKNGTSIFGLTNMGIIDFAPGENDIIIYGSKGPISTRIETRFYYL